MQQDKARDPSLGHTVLEEDYYQKIIRIYKCVGVSKLFHASVLLTDKCRPGIQV